MRCRLETSSKRIYFSANSSKLKSNPKRCGKSRNYTIRFAKETCSCSVRTSTTCTIGCCCASLSEHTNSIANTLRNSTSLASRLSFWTSPSANAASSIRWSASCSSTRVSCRCSHPTILESSSANLNSSSKCRLTILR